MHTFKLILSILGLWMILAVGFASILGSFIQAGKGYHRG